jgi:selenide,water dikinase
LHFPSDPNVLRGVDSRDNAGVYRLTDELAIVQTVDFFTPVVDDPYTFGQIAVANSLSDIYTMGARPLTAMNLVCFPRDTLEPSVLKEILRGGLDKMTEAKVALVGGHSVDDPELKYGLSVTGVVDPQRLITNGGARIGDRLILTKPLGTGIISTALKNGAASKLVIDRVAASMATLNDKSSAAMRDADAHSCTDITGFGFLGHALQMAQNSGVGFVIAGGAVPFFPEAIDFSVAGFLPGGLQRNRDYYSTCVTFASGISEHLRRVLFDPQTSGGLLISVGAASAAALLGVLRGAGLGAVAVGDVVGEPSGKIVVQ